MIRIGRILSCRGSAGFFLGAELVKSDGRDDRRFDL